MLEKTIGKSRKDNPETQTTLGTRHRTKTNKTKNTKHKTKQMNKMECPKTGMNPGHAGACEG
jgi:hypothetical protein